MNYTRNELFSIAKRYNNLKRTYLIVNKKQSKYLPSKPSETFAMTNALAQKMWQSGVKDENTLVIGFAETATAIGRLIADHFSLDLRNTPEEVEKLTFFLLGIPTGKLVKGLSSIEIGLTCSDDNTDDNTNDIVALLEIPNLSWGVKCVNLCNFEHREDSWVFKEIAKRIKMDDFYCTLWD